MQLDDCSRRHVVEVDQSSQITNSRQLSVWQQQLSIGFAASRVPDGRSATTRDASPLAPCTPDTANSRGCALALHGAAWTARARADASTSVCGYKWINCSGALKSSLPWLAPLPCCIHRVTFSCLGSASCLQPGRAAPAAPTKAIRRGWARRVSNTQWRVGWSEARARRRATSHSV